MLAVQRWERAAHADPRSTLQVERIEPAYGVGYGPYAALYWEPAPATGVRSLGAVESAGGRAWPYALLGAALGVLAGGLVAWHLTRGAT